jgi:hypothetical protein
MKASIFIFLFVQIGLILAEKWPCDRKKAIAAFKEKAVTNAWPVFKKDPYKNQTEASEAKIQEYLKDHTSVCAIRYTDSSRKRYEIRDFPNNITAERNGFIVTHQGRCGACSNLKDLAVYLERNLTGVVRSCGLKIIDRFVTKCLTDLGFTPRCVDIWKYNVYNTKRDCFWTCMWAFITGKPNNNPDGSLNDCLQCDEDKSGPVFKYFAGRTRRNSGIRSAIDRPTDQVYEMNHCYF